MFETFIYSIYLAYFLIFMLGASVASFLCVLLEEEKKDNLAKPNIIHGIKLRKLFGKSICKSCNRNLKWYELIPVFSFLIQNAKCRNCKSKIPFSFFVAEVILGLFFVNLFFFPLYEQDNLIKHLYFLFVVIYLFILSYQDYLYQEVESWKLYLFVASGLMSNLSFYLIEGSNNNAFYIILFSIFLYLFLVLYSVFGKNKYMGQGDFLVLLGILFFYGLENFVNIFVYSVWIGAIFSVIYLFKKYKNIRNFKREEKLPFIPFLFLGVFFFHITQYKLFVFKDILELIYFLFK